MNTSRDWQPTIFVRDPPEERDAANHLMLHISMLETHEGYFRAAVRLLDHVETLRRTAERGEQMAISSWGMIAAHHAAITITNFRDTVAAIKHAAGQMPSISSLIDSKTLHSMPEKFAAEFPDHKETRDGFAHSADKMFSAAKIDSNRGNNVVFEHSNLYDRQLVYTIDGKRVTLDVTEESLAKLISLKRQVYEVFRKVSAW